MAYQGYDLFGAVTAKDKLPEADELSRKERRNECLLDRYYLYVALDRMQMNDAYELLMDDFFISEATLKDILQLNGEYVRLLRKKEVSRKELERKWPRRVW